MELLAQDIIEQDIIGKIGGCGAELNREIVSCRACVRADRGAVFMSSEFRVKFNGPPFSLSLLAPGGFPFFPKQCLH